MSTSQTLTLNYSADGLSKLEVPKQTVQPGEPVRIYLWGRSAEDLMGYKLGQGAENLGPGTLRQYPGQTTEAYFDLTGDGVAQDFDWPVLSLASVTAYGNLYAVDGNDVSLVALPGEDVTRYFRLSGNALVRNVEAGAPTITGSVRAVANRSPWCREWRWTAPDLGISQRTRLTIRNVFSSKDGALIHTIKPIASTNTPAHIFPFVNYSEPNPWNYKYLLSYGIEKLDIGYCTYVNLNEQSSSAGYGAETSCILNLNKFNGVKIDILFKSPCGTLPTGTREEIEIYFSGSTFIYCSMYYTDYSQVPFAIWMAFGSYYLDARSQWNNGAMPSYLKDGSWNTISYVINKNNASILVNGNYITGIEHNGDFFNYAIDLAQIRYQIKKTISEITNPYEKSKTRLASITVTVS